MRELDEFKKSIEVYDEKAVNLLSRLDQMDPKTEEYKEVEQRLKTMAEIKQIEVENFNKTKESAVPAWFTSLIATVSALGLGLFLYNGEAKGTVIGSTAVSMLNKFKFGR